MKAIEELVRINFEEDPTPIICIKGAKIKPLGDGVAIYARVANDENNDLAKQICNLRKQSMGVGDVNFTEYTLTTSTDSFYVRLNTSNIFLDYDKINIK